MTPTPAKVLAALARAATTTDIIAALKLFGVTQHDIGVAFGVNRQTVSRWKMTDDPAPYPVLVGLRDLALLLANVLEPEQVGAWMRGQHRMLDAIPLELLQAGHTAQVWVAASALADSAYI